MTMTSFPPSFYRPRIAEPLRTHRPAVDEDVWTPAIAWFSDPQLPQSVWQMAACVDVDVDPGVVGHVRLRSSRGSFSVPAEIAAYVERLIIGWEPITAEPERIWVEAARSVGSPGGAVKVLRASCLLMQVPPASQGRGPRYPINYTPPGAPDTTPPFIPAGQTLNVQDDTPNGSLVGTITATDDVAVTFMDIIGGNNGGAFTLAPATGQLYVNSQTAIAENGPFGPFSLTVIARDAASNSYTETVTVTVSNAPDPEAPVIPAGQSFNVPDATVDGTYVGWVANSDNVAVVYLDITAGNTGGAFHLDDDGSLYVNSQAAMVDNGPAFTLTATARDAAGNETTETFTVTVTTTVSGYYGGDYRPAAPTPLRTVAVTTATFAAAVDDAQPGDRLELATGNYGNWDITGTGLAGTAANPIVVTPAAGATVTFTELDIRENCSHLWLGNFHGEAEHTNFIFDAAGGGGALVRIGWDQNRSGSHAQNSVDNITICGAHLTNVGYNHMVIKGGATDVRVINNKFSDAGQIHADLGENIYIGQASTSNPSPCERILVQGNWFEGATADVVDVKMSNVQDIQILDNYFDGAVFGDTSSDHFTNGAVGITQIQTQQIRDPQIKVLRNVFHDISHVGTVSRSRAITTSAPGEYAYNIVFRTGRESMRVNHVGSLPSWWTPDLQYDFHHNTCFDHSSISGGSGNCIHFSGVSGSVADRLRVIDNVYDGTMPTPAGADVSNNHEADLVDFAGPTTGSGNAGTHVGSGYQLASGSAIPLTAGALGKVGNVPTGPVGVIGSGSLAYDSGTTFTIPSSIQDGDILLVGVSEAGSGDPGASTASIPAGALTEIYSDKPEAGNYRPRQTLLGRSLIAATDAGDTCTVVQGTLADSTCWVVLRGLVGLPGSKVQQAGSDPDGIQFPSIAASTDDVLILHGSAQSSTPVAGDASSLSVTVTEVEDQLSNGRGNWLAIHLVAAGGTIDPGTLVDTNGAPYDNWVATVTKSAT